MPRTDTSPIAASTTTAAIALTAALLALSGCAHAQPITTPPAGSKATVALLETTDLHSHVLGYDYYKLAPDASVGFDRILTLIKAARAEFVNTVLLDNGDTIQGSALADFQALDSPLACSQTLAIYRAMNAAGYDGAGVGNHEFNYGLKFLAQATGQRFDVAGLPPVAEQKTCAGPNFPVVLANIHSTQSKAPLFKPYAIINKTITATLPDGKTAQLPLKVGIVGFTPPAILKWDQRFLEGKVYAVGPKEAAVQYVAELKAQGADVVVLIAHAGLDASPYRPDMENAAYHLAQVSGVDAMLLGHSHQVFPNANSRSPQFNLPGVDKALGTVHGVPTVMSGFWGKSLGVIALQLQHDGKTWVVDKTATQVSQRSPQLPAAATHASASAPGSGAPRGFVAADASVAELIATEHAAAVAYVKTPLGASDFALSSYFSEVGDVSAIQIVNMAQAAYLRAQIKAARPELAQFAVISLSAPFKSGFGGGGDYTDVRAGPMAINNAADLYLYPNTLQGVRVTGAELKAWLETAARRFNRIDPTKTEPQELLANFPGYNFDMLTDPDFAYTIDITQPVGQRIGNLRYLGAPLSPEQIFIAATNNYRASGGGSFPGLDGSKTVFAGPDTNRDVLIAHLRSVKTLSRAQHGQAQSWRFAKTPTAGPVIFKSSADKLPMAQAAGLNNISLYKADEGSGRGLSLYALDLSR